MIANSSPPQRPTRSVRRTVARSRWATMTRKASPAACPRVSLTCFRSSTSMISRQSGRRYRRARRISASSRSSSARRLAMPVRTSTFASCSNSATRSRVCSSSSSRSPGIHAVASSRRAAMAATNAGGTSVSCCGSMPSHSATRRAVGACGRARASRHRTARARTLASGSSSRIVTVLRRLPHLVCAQPASLLVGPLPHNPLPRPALVWSGHGSSTPERRPPCGLPGGDEGRERGAVQRRG